MRTYMSSQEIAQMREKNKKDASDSASSKRKKPGKHTAFRALQVFQSNRISSTVTNSYPSAWRISTICRMGRHCGIIGIMHEDNAVFLCMGQYVPGLFYPHW